MIALGLIWHMETGHTVGGKGGVKGVHSSTPKCVEPAGLCGRCTGVAVPLRVVPSPTGLPCTGRWILYTEPPGKPQSFKERLL